jgi:DNA-directed RNA polymerase subunit RPC12/RpoP
MRVICAWCGKTIEGRDDEGLGSTTYYFCKQCLAEIEALEEELSKQENGLRSLRIVDD